ncbi:MAG TPA: tetratricopeptide repeat protein [Candidatus Binataceae bacterium]|nr:tetratricopeptide repeat protein [Candidatus Binataceae bacterium]
MSAKKHRRSPPRKPPIHEAARTRLWKPPRAWSGAKLFDSPIAALAITLIVYLRCVGNAFVYDDNEMIVLNRFIGDPALTWKSFVNDSWWFRNPLKLPQSAYYRPLQDVWLAANFHLFGFAPAGWHLAIVAVHLIAVWLVFEIARELTDTRWTPIIAATIFGVLPMHAQAVVWPTAIPLPMSAMFELAALLVFIRRERGAGTRAIQRWAWSIAAPLFYALALLSHESAVVFPIILAAYGLVLAPAPERSTAMRDRFVRAALPTIPFLIELAVYLAIRFSVLGFITRLNVTNHMSRAEEWLTIPNVIGTYVVLLIAPWRAGPVHPIEMVSSIASRDFYLPALAMLGLIGSATVALWNDRRRMLYLFCAIWIFATIVPMLNLRAFSPLALVEDRYLYMPSAAWCIAIAELIISFVASIGASEASLAIVAGTIAAVYAGVLFHVESFWHDEIALFSTCTEMAPRSNLCHDRLGLALKRNGDLKGAEREFLIANEIAPDEGANLYNLGLTHAQLGRTADAVAEIKRSLARLPDAPPGAYVELAKIADAGGDTHERDAAMGQAAKLPGGLEAVEIGDAELMIAHQDFAGAERAMRAGLARDPNDADEWALLGTSLVRQGRAREALEAYRTSLSLKPDPDLRRAVATMTGGTEQPRSP